MERHEREKRLKISDTERNHFNFEFENWKKNLSLSSESLIAWILSSQVSFEHLEVDSLRGGGYQRHLLLFLPHCQGPARSTRHAQSNHIQVTKSDVASQSGLSVKNVFYLSLMTASFRRSFKACYNRNFGIERRETLKMNVN